MDAEIPPDAGEQSLRFKLRPAVRVLAFYSVISVTAVANSSSLCTRNDHVGEPGRFNVVSGTVESKKYLRELANVNQKA